MYRSQLVLLHNLMNMKGDWLWLWMRWQSRVGRTREWEQQGYRRSFIISSPTNGPESQALNKRTRSQTQIDKLVFSRRAISSVICEEVGEVAEESKVWGSLLLLLRPRIRQQLQQQLLSSTFVCSTIGDVYMLIFPTQVLQNITTRRRGTFDGCD